MNEDKSVGIYEVRQRGFFKKYKTLEILTALATNKQGEDLNTCLTLDDKQKQNKKVVLPICSKDSTTGQSDQNKYIMFAMINRGGGRNRDWKDDVNKRCRATFDTLQLASELASEAKLESELDNVIYEVNNLPASNCSLISAGGGFIKSRKNKIVNYKTLNKNRYNLYKRKGRA